MNRSMIRVGDIVTRGKSKLQWRVNSITAGSQSYTGKTIVSLEPYPESKKRYTNASAAPEQLTRIEVDE
ncbi:hypothetical protein F8O06_02860 [Pseudoclavibacter sp. CFCC 14310]|uniref:hypothetical protein n=1 Tax=Pseudoclavibacter sp. CFCC 14310 TaxID=2615180 RepID=UPI0013011A61|nr:hypothetical protein [Pseudoclavibacter sp. CFCC 14310]KAB1647498.1 hypothetical protein F8O06_02860 [Pseudoclavibacter sp. CFCC 14310]